MLTTFFDRNKEDESARQHLYKDFPKHYTWNASARRWNQRKQGSIIGRLVYANSAEGERYYLHLLLSHISGRTSFKDLFTVNGILYPIFRKAALKRSLIETDDNLSQCLAEASLFQFSKALRRLFATILIYCESGDVRKLWDEHYDSFSEDYRRECESVDRVRNMVLTDITSFLQSMGKNLDDFDLPKINVDTNLQFRSFRESDPWFSNFLLRVGDGDEEMMEESFIRIPDDMAIAYTDKDKSKHDLIDAIFPSLQINGADSNYIISRAILSTKKENVDEINDQLTDRFCGDEKVYYIFDEAEDDINTFYPMEFLNSLTVSGLPPHYLWLKIGCPIILLRNIDSSNGLCNGTRLICRGFQQNIIDAEIAVGQHAGKIVFLPRIPLCQSEDNMFPFKVKRKQFPVRLSFSKTINKAQGQTIPNVGVYLPESVFSHGQLYVALSRGTSRENTKVLVKFAKKFNRDGVYTSNVVYQEVLRD
ncbi:uncharacterized protein LOC112519933 [Cynara cardunculus var. scolymus]|uniref:uncharacterized protein LOC112519933 n=1 Tax=Cynara cardunculus var. scolymus TaxID=59895 RepID=UPI000D627BC6|nr:uncharacterized protein LOC112519933 [Cynara cardunculus var. scolymus]